MGPQHAAHGAGAPGRELLSPSQAGLAESPSGALISLGIFRSKVLYNCEKAKGSLGRGSQAAAIGQLLPQMVPAWLQLLGLTASRGSALGPHLGTIPAGSLCWSQSSCHDPLRTGPVGAGDDPGVLTATSTPVPFSPPGLMAELCLPRQGLVGAGGGQRSLGSSSQAPAAVFSRVKVQCFEIFYFEWQSWRSGVAPDPRVSVRSGAGSRAGWVQGGCRAAAAPGRMWLPLGLRPMVAPVAPRTSGCTGACSHAVPSPTLSQGRTAFPAPGCHSSFPSCSKIPMKPLSRMWGVAPQPRTPRIPLWGVCVVPWGPHGMMAQLRADGQPEGTAPAERHRARTGLLQWHGQLSPVQVMLPWGEFHPPQQPWGPSPAQEDAGSHRRAEELGFTWQQGGLALARAAMATCHHQWVTHAAKRTGGMTTGAGDGCRLMGSQEADASPRHRFWLHFIKPHVFQKYLEMHTSTAVQGPRWGWVLPVASGAGGCVLGVLARS